MSHGVFTLPVNHLYLFGNQTGKIVRVQGSKPTAESVDIIRRWQSNPKVLVGIRKKQSSLPLSGKSFFSLFLSIYLACAYPAVQWLLNLGTMEDLHLGQWARALLEKWLCTWYKLTHIKHLTKQLLNPFQQLVTPVEKPGTVRFSSSTVSPWYRVQGYSCLSSNIDNYKKGRRCYVLKVPVLPTQVGFWRNFLGCSQLQTMWHVFWAFAQSFPQ